MYKEKYERIAFKFTSSLPSNRHEESIGRPERRLEQPEKQYPHIS